MKQDSSFPGIGAALLLVSVVVAIQVGLTIPLTIYSLATQSELFKHPGCVGVINIIAFGSVLVWGAWKNGARLGEIFTLKPVKPIFYGPVLLAGSGLMIVLSEADNVVRSVLPPPRWIAEAFSDLTQAKTSLWGSFFALVIVAPVTEELFFRGLMLRGFLSRYSARKSLVVSALLFGLIHLNPWQFATAACLGLVFGWWFLWTRSLWPCVIGHVLANSLVLWHSYLPVKIRGFNLGEAFAPEVQFQPWWFDLVGLCLAGAGFWWFAKLVRPGPGLTAMPTAPPDLPASREGSLPPDRGAP